MNGRNGGQNISKVFERCKIASNKCKAYWQNVGINLQNQSISQFSKQCRQQPQRYLFLLQLQKLWQAVPHFCL